MAYQSDRPAPDKNNVGRLTHLVTNSRCYDDSNSSLHPMNTFQTWQTTNTVNYAQSTTLPPYSHTTVDSSHQTDPMYTYDVNASQSYVCTPLHCPAEPFVEEPAFFGDIGSQMASIQRYSQTYGSNSSIANSNSYDTGECFTSDASVTDTSWTKGDLSTPHTIMNEPCPRLQVGSIATTTIAIGNRKKPPIYFCDVSGCTSQGFTSFHNFEYHQRSHLNSRPFVCPDCSRGFTARWDLTRHQKRKGGSCGTTSLPPTLAGSVRHSE
ncbi:hypothetical protein E1B28_002870 [Marasmius oreades]|uniref:C2H2-type domain-containing protein n=1 Tax=Marasmius oreades TaxID=181124 RepID=A0A9P7RQ07_9AGAR|nr:uncharacterized protein E1B28_002870 [Marasmius oreades]KAG7086953.1 hypothetical protein E1B28_002870 [Marasmius oreades]